MYAERRRMYVVLNVIESWEHKSSVKQENGIISYTCTCKTKICRRKPKVILETKKGKGTGTLL